MAQTLREKGYRAYALKGGYDAWREAGLPVEDLQGQVHAPTP